MKSGLDAMPLFLLEDLLSAIRLKDETIFGGFLKNIFPKDKDDFFTFEYCPLVQSQFHLMEKSVF